MLFGDRVDISRVRVNRRSLQPPCKRDRVNARFIACRGTDDMQAIRDELPIIQDRIHDPCASHERVRGGISRSCRVQSRSHPRVRRLLASAAARRTKAVRAATGVAALQITLARTVILPRYYRAMSRHALVVVFAMLCTACVGSRDDGPRCASGPRVPPQLSRDAFPISDRVRIEGVVRSCTGAAMSNVTVVATARHMAGWLAAVTNDRGSSGWNNCQAAQTDGSSWRITRDARHRAE
jgi:hypothetical protein